MISNIEKLIEELCPEGVEFRELGEIASFLNGKGHEKSISESGDYIVVNSKFISTEGRVKKHSDQQLCPIYINDVLIVMSDLPNGRALAKCFHVNSNDLYTLNQRIGALAVKNKKLIYARYLYYILNRNKQLLRYDNGVDQTNLRKDSILKIKIPIPPLEVQKEIVRILDRFTELEAELEVELEAELKARRIQYEYYRDNLLLFKNSIDVKWMKLGAIAIYSNTRIDAKIMTAETYVGVDNLLQNRMGKTFATYIPTDGTVISYQTNDILIGNIRPYLKKIWLATNNGGTNGDVLTIKIEDECKAIIMPKYLYFILSSDAFFTYNTQYSKGAKMPRGDKSAIMNYPIPIPPIAEQERIVLILDKFDKLVNDITEGLPAEIAARRQQYEHYRAKLLDFKNINA